MDQHYRHEFRHTYHHLGQGHGRHRVPDYIGRRNRGDRRRPAPIRLVNPTQINAFVPATSTLGNVDVVVSNSNGSSKAASLSLATTSPGLFTFSPNQGAMPPLWCFGSATSFEYLAPANLLD
jgi:uncharacterized protein (TIGR03437 family)